MVCRQCCRCSRWRWSCRSRCTCSSSKRAWHPILLHTSSCRQCRLRRCVRQLHRRDACVSEPQSIYLSSALCVAPPSSIRPWQEDCCALSCCQAMFPGPRSLVSTSLELALQCALQLNLFSWAQAQTGELMERLRAQGMAMNRQGSGQASGMDRMPSGQAHGNEGA